MLPIKLKRDAFPNLPDEIWSTFIERLNNDGLNDFDFNSHGRWFVHFGGLSIKGFSDLRWRMISHPLAELRIALDAYTTIDIDEAIKFLLSDDSPESRARFKRYDPMTRKTIARYVKFIEKTRCLPTPIVGIRTSTGFRVLDGHHRLIAALYFEAQNSISIDIDAWIGI